MSGTPIGFAVYSTAELRQWIIDDNQQLDASGNITVTFVVDENGTLRVSDRCSEHVACAGGRPVQSAGEMTFQILKHHVEVEAVTNQSTGYCPEPSSWPQVARALCRASLVSPSDFSVSFLFRRCTFCSAVNVIKEDIFICAMCDAELSQNWNID